MKPERRLFETADARKFQLNCEADRSCGFHTGSDSFTVTVAQCIRRDGSEEMWDSVGVYAQEEEDGTLVVRILVFNPDWDEPLQIACIRSRPGDVTSLTALGCNLDHVVEPQDSRGIESPFRSPAVRGGNPKA